MMDVPVLSIVPLCILVYAYRRWRKSTVPYPPGPKGYPILGNVFDLPMSVPIWETLTALASRHDTDVLHLNLMGDVMVSLSSSQAISDLIDKRSGIYADRPQPPMLQLTGASEWGFPVMAYGSRWRARRKLFHEALNEKMSGSYDGHQHKHVYRFLSRLLEEPGSFTQEVDLLPGAVILSVAYGIDAKSTENPLLRSILDATRTFTSAVVPGKFVVDVFPKLRYLPDWFPGTGFKVLANEARHKLQESVDRPMEYVKNIMKSDEKFTPSVTSNCLSRLWDEEKTTFDEEVIRDVSGVMFSAGADTTRSALQTFFLAMLLNPKVQKKAQEELDRVIGKGRLPDFSDREDLPYISAVVREVLRLNPPFPFGVPARATQNDEYRGYLIPEGATVVQNIWAICRDPNIYPDPEAFNPDRFLKDGKIDPSVLNPEDRVFGAGRRICPGRHFALRSLYLVMACVPAVFDIEPTVNEYGNPVIPEAEFTGDSLVRGPKPFKCAIKPRSEGVIKLVKEAYDRVSNN